MEAARRFNGGKRIVHAPSALGYARAYGVWKNFLFYAYPAFTLSARCAPRAMPGYYQPSLTGLG